MPTIFSSYANPPFIKIRVKYPTSPGGGVILNLVLNLIQYWFRIPYDETLKRVQGDI